MIDSGKRVVVFLDQGADGSSVNYILPEFEMVWETQFGVTDRSFPCTVDRVAGPLPNDQHMYMINHSLNEDFLGILIPNFGQATTTNGAISWVLPCSAVCFAKFTSLVQDFGKRVWMRAIRGWPSS
jgi:hypothetical protein